MGKGIDIKEVLDDDGDIISILLIDENGKTLADLSSKASETIVEADFIDDYIEGRYTSDETGLECNALFNSHGKLVRKGIREILNFIETKIQFIITVNADESEYNEYKKNYASDDPDWLYCVIDSTGGFVIEPLKKKIEYNETAEVYLIEESNLYDGSGFSAKLAPIKCDFTKYIFYEQNKKLGIIRKGEILTDADYQRIIPTAVEAKFWVRQDGKWKVLHFNFDDDMPAALECVETDFDDVESIGNISFKYHDMYDNKLVALNNIFEVRKNGSVGVVNTRAEIILPIIYDYISYNHFYTERGGKENFYIGTKISHTHYEFGSLYKDRDGTFKISSEPLLFFKKFPFTDTFIQIENQNGERKIVLFCPENTDNDSLNIVGFEMDNGFGYTSSTDYVTDFIKKETLKYSAGKNQKVVFEFWYIDERGKEVFLDAEVRFENQ